MAGQEPPASTQVWILRFLLAGCGVLLTMLFSYSAWTFRATAEDSKHQFVVLQQAQSQLASEIDREADARRSADAQMIEALHALEIRMTRNEALTDHLQDKERVPK